MRKKPERKHYKPGTMVCVRTLKGGRVEVIITEPSEQQRQNVPQQQHRG